MFFTHVDAIKDNFFKYLAVFILVFFGYFIGQFPLFLVVGTDNMDAFQENPDFTEYGMDPNLGFFLMLIMFILAFLALWAGIKFIHGKNLKSIIRPQSGIDYKRIMWACLFWFGLTMIIELIMYTQNSQLYELNFNTSRFIPLLILSLLVLPIQTSFEELLFRGYFLQGIGKGTKSKLAALIITTLMFALIHGTNPEVVKYGATVMMSYYITAGLALGIMTIMDDGLELALGVHAATNIYGALIVSYDGSAIQTDSIFKTSDINPLIMLIASLIAFAIFLIIAQRKYQWGSFNTILESVNDYDEKVDKP